MVGRRRREASSSGRPVLLLRHIVSGSGGLQAGGNVQLAGVAVARRGPPRGRPAGRHRPGGFPRPRRLLHGRGSAASRGAVLARAAVGAGLRRRRRACRWLLEVCSRTVSVSEERVTESRGRRERPRIAPKTHCLARLRRIQVPQPSFIILFDDPFQLPQRYYCLHFRL